MNNDLYTIEYIKHSLFEEYKTIKCTSTITELIDFLKNGMITVISAKKLNYF